MALGIIKDWKRKSQLKQDLKEKLDLSIGQTSDLQGQAADPNTSVWVSANAGTGKTHVLVNRVLRILLTGMPPEKLLCLTYTNAAAAEMSNRLFSVLSLWAVISDKELVKQFKELVGHKPKQDEMDKVRTLFARTLETPGSLKIQTIHSFCDRLLRRFPLEAGIVPNSSLLDEQLASEIRKEAEERVLRKAAENPNTPLGEALRTMIIYTAEGGFSDIISVALGHKNIFYRVQQNYSHEVDPIAVHIQQLERELGLEPGMDRHSLETAQAALLTPKQLTSLYDILNSGSKTDQKRAVFVAEARHGKTLEVQVAALAAAMLTKDGKPLKTLMTKKLREAYPDLDEQFLNAQEQFHALQKQKEACLVREATESLLRLSDAILKEYEVNKSNRASLDFDDLIDKSANLLSGTTDSAWVLFKLDGGLDHILVDEAQDTSPQQWEVILGLVSEFFSGKGRHEDRFETPRTIFAVGDEKQSIYSFQGAVPAEFAKTGSRLEQRVSQAGQQWKNIPLTLNFRSTGAVLESVDETFADGEKVKGLSFSGQKIEHKAAREGQAGRIEIWPLEKPEELDTVSVWSPEKDTQIPEEPINVLADRIASTIARWLKDGEVLASLNRPIRPGDILILLRRRQPFATPMIRALKKYNIPVAGADRMKLMEQIAVQDLVVLGDFLLLPENDLALATILKSPLFGLDDMGLYKIAYGRKKSLWSVLNGKATEDAALAKIVTVLRSWLKRADQMPPFELFSSVLEMDGAREKLVSRLGAEAGDAIDEFLNLALRYDSNSAPSLQGFLESLRENSSDIKRDMDQGLDEVRIMTVHGAKGLEANVVFLPDTVAQKGRPRSVLTMPASNMPPGSPDHLIWAVGGTNGVAAVQDLKARNKESEQEEYNRLLYVAMTRARDRLYICGWETSSRNPAKDGCWYRLMESALQPFMTQIPFEGGAEGQTVLRLDQPQILDVSEEEKAGNEDRLESAMPSWTQGQAPGDILPIRRFSPSRIGGDIAKGMTTIDRLDDAIEEEEDQILVYDDLSLKKVDLQSLDLEEDSDDKIPAYDQLLRGTITHALLEHLPSLPRDRWDMAAEQLVSGYGHKLPGEVLLEVMDEVLLILSREDLAFLFGDNSKAEVSFQVGIPAKSKTGRTTRISGQIDRLIVDKDSVTVIDYKSNRDVPASGAEVSGDYLVQLAAYRIGASKIFPDMDIRCGLLWTATGTLMMLDDFKMQALEEQLVTNLQSGLDATL